MADVLFMEEGKVVAFADSTTAKGNKMYRMQVEDLDTGDTDWFGFGFDAAEFGEGSVISFEYEESGKYLNADAGSIEVLDLVEPKSRGSRGSRSNGRNGGHSSGRGNDNSGSSRSSRSSRSNNDSGADNKRSASNKDSNSDANKDSSEAVAKGETNWAEKDLRTGLGYAREQAIKTLGAMLEQDAISLPAKKAEKMDSYLQYLDMLTARFLEQGDNYVKDGVGAIYEDAADE